MTPLSHDSLSDVEARPGCRRHHRARPSRGGHRGWAYCAAAAATAAAALPLRRSLVAAPASSDIDKPRPSPTDYDGATRFRPFFVGLGGHLTVPRLAPPPRRRAIAPSFSPRTDVTCGAPRSLPLPLLLLPLYSEVPALSSSLPFMVVVLEGDKHPCCELSCSAAAEAAPTRVMSNSARAASPAAGGGATVSVGVVGVFPAAAGGGVVGVV